ncbi:selenocysteinyl-tRNA-specific translation factor [Salmonella enterica subsp. arizonae]|uniref:Selenocysteine-specific elongation factor n=1 Tax=Salmonella enterica subsp. arizonae TaxID=59203 RepID=A0A379T494_SALER|nr:selenocysteinyl-tRNA-specific translation factor [Salmonella enterica subsp. arizonae]
MTIDLGYAYWPQPDGRVLGFIDVPGHEKFLSNMLAGVGGIDHALLVVACDDGVMAQTREHLQILQLTGNPQLTVALTKADRVDEARIREVREEVLATLDNYGFADAVLFVTAANEGRGIAVLRAHLQQLPARLHACAASLPPGYRPCVYGERGRAGSDRNGAERRSESWRYAMVDRR